jgi:hypothetical protein
MTRGRSTSLVLRLLWPHLVTGACKLYPGCVEVLESKQVKGSWTHTTSTFVSHASCRIVMWLGELLLTLAQAIRIP